MENLNQKGKEFAKYIDDLKILVSEHLKVNKSSVIINEDEAFKYYQDGYSAEQCFREEW